ncbi:hypothetical protein FOL47_009298 [Perkinsus chesapeaki]|uniref:Uncharacterized protein n=1 Tax=Perkinsus chesapeaki TaxID=330153 RepID=A0A7J6MRZ8_PERCH|nr:hypothetical protein FOL47_009298 [Perkinsus chesapeaki]
MAFNLSLKESSSAKRARVTAAASKASKPAFSVADAPSEPSDTPTEPAAPELDLDSLAELRDDGCTLADAGEFREAISSWSRIVRAGKAGADVHNWIAQAYMELDEDWRAVHHAEIAYTGDRGYALTYARALFNYGELEKCKDIIDDNVDTATQEDKKDMISLLADVGRLSSLVEKDMAEHHRGVVVNGRTVTMPFWETAQRVDYDEEGRPHVKAPEEAGKRTSDDTHDVD